MGDRKNVKGEGSFKNIGKKHRGTHANYFLKAENVIKS